MHFENSGAYTGEISPLMLKELGCEFVQGGKGSHMRWRSRTGSTFIIPRHAGDLCTGTVRSILRQAGIHVSVSAFARAS